MKNKTSGRKHKKNLNKVNRTRRSKNNDMYFWDSINTLYKNKNFQLIQKYHNDRKREIFKIFNKIYNSLKHKYIFEYNVDNYINLFRINNSSDSDKIQIYKMKPFIIYNKQLEKLIECKLGGFGTKINSDIDIDFVFYSVNKDTQYIYKIIKKYLIASMKLQPFGAKFDTNFYFSFNKPVIIKKNIGEKNIDFTNSFISLYIKIVTRENIDNINYELIKPLNFTNEELNIIKKYYTVNSKLSKRELIDIENNLFSIYANSFNKNLNNYNNNDNNFNNLYRQFRILQPHSYIFILSVYFALKDDNKINYILGKYNEGDKNIILYLVSLENLFECYYNNKPKYLLRALYSLSMIKDKKDLLLDKDLIRIVNEFLVKQKDSNKKNIPYCITDAIITDLIDYGECNNKIKCNIIKDIKKTNNLDDIDYCKKSKNINYQSVIREMIKILIDNIKEITKDYDNVLDELAKLIRIKIEL